MTLLCCTLSQKPFIWTWHGVTQTYCLCNIKRLTMCSVPFPQALIFLDLVWYTALQRVGFVAKWSVAMKFFPSGLTSASVKYSFELFSGSLWGIHLWWSWCFLVTCWLVILQSWYVVSEHCSINFSIIFIITQVVKSGRIFLSYSFTSVMCVMVCHISIKVSKLIQI